MRYQLKDTILQVENLCVAYGDKVIIKDVNFIERDVTRDGATQGQCIALLGRSGRGKSTLFRAITGLVTPTAGHVLIPDFNQQGEDGSLVAKYVEEGDVGFVDQKYTLFRHKTVYSSLMFALRNSGLSKQDKHESVMSYLVEWGLEKSKDQYPNELSGGQRQRTAIIEQLLTSGYFIVMDEPFSGLDVGNILSVKNAFDLINQRHDLNTIIFSTHDIDLAVELADSIYIIGCTQDEKGEHSSYGTLVGHFDLKALGLAWKKELTPEHLGLIKEIKEVMFRS